MLLLLANSSSRRRRVLSPIFVPPFNIGGPGVGGGAAEAGTLSGDNVIVTETIQKRRHWFNKNTSTMLSALEDDGPTQHVVGSVMGLVHHLMDTGVLDDSREMELQDLVDEERSNAEIVSRRNRDTNEEIQVTIRDLQEAVAELQKLQLAARKDDVEEDGWIKHGSYCEALDAQFIRVESPGLDTYIEIKHGLQRVPQGCIWINWQTRFRILVEGDRPFSIPPANRYSVHFLSKTTIGDTAQCILF